MKNDNKKNKTLLIIGIITTILLLTLGITYAAFSYMQTGEDNHEVVLGDIYMHYQETNQLLLENAMPSSFKLNTLKLPSVTTYKVNPVMKEQEIVENELSRCITFFGNAPFDEGSTAETFCKGTGTLQGLTFEYGLNNGLVEDLTAAGYSDLYIEEEGVYKPNPIIATQEINELSRCVNYFNGMPVDEGSTIESFCQGTGTAFSEMTFETLITTAPDDAIQEMLLLDIILENELPSLKYNYTSLIVNPNMEGEVLESCKTIITDLGNISNDYLVKELEKFCQGEAPNAAGKSISDLATDTAFLQGDGHQLLRSGVVLAKIENLPYFEFTISGKNTYSKKDIYYDVVLTHGDNHETRTERIRDDLLRFTLTEVDSNGNEISLVKNISLTDLKNGERIYVETIPKNTMDEINKTYRLYMDISEYTVICGGDVNDSCDYYTDGTPNWNDVFASIKINVTGDFNEKNYRYLFRDFKGVVESKSGTSVTDTDGTIYLSGSSETYYKYPLGVMQNTEKIIDYNYVLYSGILWRITAIYPDGTLKLVTENTIGDPIQWGGDGKFINSNVYTYLNNDFLNTLDNYENVIVEDYKWNVAEFVTSKEIGESEYVTAPVGLINSYEYWNSYQNVSTVCSLSRCDGYYKSYLADYQSNSWWLLNNKIAGKEYNYVSNSSGPGFATVEEDTWNATDSLYVRPSIVLKPNVLTSGGDGSYDNPYVINTGNN